MAVALSPPVADAVQNLTDVGTASILRELETSRLLEAGKAHVISVGSIHQAFGVRWEQRRSLVWDFVTAQITKRIGGHDFFARISDEEFLIVTPKLGVSLARFLAVSALRDTLVHFLGQSSSEDIVVKVVTSFIETSLTCRPLTKDELESAISGAPGDDSSYSSRAAEVDLAAPDQPTPLVAFDGRRLRFSSSIDPIIDLRQWAIAGHRIEPKLVYEDSRLALTPCERRRLLPRDVQAMDLSTLRRGVARLAEDQSSPVKPSLILTVSFLTLSNTNARTAFLTEAHRSRQKLQKAVIWEIADFESGVPPGRVKEIVSLLLPFGRSVFSRVETWPSSTQCLKSAPVAGLVLPVSPLTSSADDVAAWLLSAGRQSRKMSAAFIAANLPGKDFLAHASEAGFTHATIRTPVPHTA